MYRICSGYWDEKKRLRKCGKIMGVVRVNTVNNDNGPSHGICDECFKQFMRVVKMNLKQAKGKSHAKQVRKKSR